MRTGQTEQLIDSGRDGVDLLWEGGIQPPFRRHGRNDPMFEAHHRGAGWGGRNHGVERTEGVDEPAYERDADATVPGVEMHLPTTRLTLRIIDVTALRWYYPTSTHQDGRATPHPTYYKEKFPDVPDLLTIDYCFGLD